MSNSLIQKRTITGRIFYTTKKLAANSGQLGAHCIVAAGFQPAADHILDWFEIFGSMVPWFHGSISKCLAAVPVFIFRATRHFVLFSCEFKICAEVVVHRIFAVFLNSLNGKNSSKTIARDIFCPITNHPRQPLWTSRCLKSAVRTLRGLKNNIIRFSGVLSNVELNPRLRVVPIFSQG